MNPPSDIDVILLSAAKTPALRQTTETAIQTLHASEDPTRVRFHPLVIESVVGARAGYAGADTIFPPIPFGYHRYMNIGVQAGKSPFVAMCNNDLVFHRGWASRLLEAFDADAALMSASPYCAYFHGRVLPKPEHEIIAGYENGIHVSGWCIVVRRSIFTIIGPLDERFEFWYCDDDYRRTLALHGVKHALVTTSRVDHLGSRTLETEDDPRRKDRITSRQALLFQYKWGHRNLLLYWLKYLKYSLTHVRRGRT